MEVAEPIDSFDAKKNSHDAKKAREDTHLLQLSKNLHRISTLVCGYGAQGWCRTGSIFFSRGTLPLLSLSLCLAALLRRATGVG